MSDTPPTDLSQIEKNGKFRVSIFGSARTKPDTPVYKMTYDLAKSLAEQEIGVVTGGGPGVMQAANEGHKAGNKNGSTNSIGLTIRLPWEAEGNEFLDHEEFYSKFSGRLDQFMRLSNVVVIMPGGIGTCLELFYTWQLIQVGHICHMPIITVGETWKQLIEWVKSGLLETEHTISPQDLNMIFSVSTEKEALEIIQDAHETFEKAGDHYCFNWKKYE